MSSHAGTSNNWFCICSLFKFVLIPFLKQWIFSDLSLLNYLGYWRRTVSSLISMGETNIQVTSSDICGLRSNFTKNYSPGFRRLISFIFLFQHLTSKLIIFILILRNQKIFFCKSAIHIFRFMVEKPTSNKFFLYFESL